MACPVQKLPDKIIGRVQEQRILHQILKSKKAEFLALYGRKGTGKTFLIKSFFNRDSCIFFHVTGKHDDTMVDHLKKFTEQIGNTFYGGISLLTQKSWLETFGILTKAMQDRVESKQKIILFFDELPWMATKRSRLLQALEYYWNRYWSYDPRIKLIICGSSASWIIENIINNQKGFSNRVSQTMKLIPFTLLETKEFLEHLGISLSERQILDIYMAIGGIPYYLEKLSKLKRGRSTQQYISELWLQSNGALINEFNLLFASLFDKSDIYIGFIRKIAKHHLGFSQAELVRRKESRGGGRAIQRLKHLEEAGFIQSFISQGYRKRGTFYKIIDEYTLSYIHWIEPHLTSIRQQKQHSHFRAAKCAPPSWKDWADIAFGAVCHKHIEQIQRALNIDTGAKVGSWRYSPKHKKQEKEAEFDQLFDRTDDFTTLCEIKYSDKPLMISKDYALQLERKKSIYREQTKTKKHIFLAIITPCGLKESKYSNRVIDQEAILDDLFT